jgi:hypothetical protein
LQDGTTERFKTISNIARDSSGRIHNERRLMVTESATLTPQLVSTHIYDPTNRVSTVLTPMQHMARQTKLQGPAPDYEQAPSFPSVAPVDRNGEPLWRQEDLGTQVMEDVTVHGRRIVRNVSAAASGTGQPVVVTDEYWYSDDLHLNMLMKHNDPRTGEQTLTVTQVKRGEPDPLLFTVPPDYKLVDETPPAVK